MSLVCCRQVKCTLLFDASSPDRNHDFDQTINPVITDLTPYTFSFHPLGRPVLDAVNKAVEERGAFNSTRIAELFLADRTRIRSAAPRILIAGRTVCLSLKSDIAIGSSGITVFINCSTPSTRVMDPPGRMVLTISPGEFGGSVNFTVPLLRGSTSERTITCSPRLSRNMPRDTMFDRVLPFEEEPRGETAKAPVKSEPMLESPVTPIDAAPAAPLSTPPVATTTAASNDDVTFELFIANGPLYIDLWSAAVLKDGDVLAQGSSSRSLTIFSSLNGDDPYRLQGTSAIVQLKCVSDDGDVFGPEAFQLTAQSHISAPQTLASITASVDEYTCSWSILSSDDENLSTAILPPECKVTVVERPQVSLVVEERAGTVTMNIASTLAVNKKQSVTFLLSCLTTDSSVWSLFPSGAMLRIQGGAITATRPLSVETHGKPVTYTCRAEVSLDAPSGQRDQNFDGLTIPEVSVHVVPRLPMLGVETRYMVQTAEAEAGSHAWIRVHLVSSLGPLLIVFLFGLAILASKFLPPLTMWGAGLAAWHVLWRKTQQKWRTPEHNV
jgi:hypothetical protein